MARIVYAEDDELVGELVQTALIDAGHAIGVVGNGKDALQAVRRRKPDLLILDIGMPEMSGSEVLTALRRDAEVYDLPVLILTGRRSREDEAIAFHQGATDYLRKPFDADELVATVNLMLLESQPRAPEKPKPRVV